MLTALLSSLVAHAAPPAHSQERPRAPAEQEPRVTLAPAPNWVRPAPQAVTKVAPSEGLTYLVLDSQTRHTAGQSWRFNRGELEVSAASGVQAAGRRLFNWTPPHQRLVLHRLDVRRAAQISSHLDANRIQVIQRETELESDVYSGTRTAIVLLPDVRVGDSIVYEYSVIGSNPVFDGHLMDGWSQRLGVPVGWLHFRLETDREVFSRFFAGATVERSGAAPLHVLSWEGSQLAELRYEQDVPPEYDQGPWLQLSDFPSWLALAEWGSRLFALPTTPNPEVKRVADELVAKLGGDVDVPLVSGALELVQQRVRYTSLAFSESTHRPAAPEVVLARGYGDCKDKSLLLVAILRSLGISADVVLVRSAGGYGLPELLPSAYDFDHAIVRVVLGEAQHWLDPTRTEQRGDLGDVAATGFGYGLVLRPDTTELSRIAEPERSLPDTSATLNYRFSEFGAPITLHAQVEYSGAHADAVRSAYAATSPEEFSERAANTVLETHPSAVRRGLASFVDKAPNNAVVVELDFDLADAWTKAANGAVSFSLFPPWLRQVLPSPAPDRKAPLLIEHPQHIVHVLNVQLPSGIATETEERAVRSAGFEFAYSAKRIGDELRLRYSFKTEQRRIEPSLFDVYRQSLNEMGQLLEYSIFEHAAVGAGGAPWVLVLYGAWGVLLVFAVRWLSQRKWELRMPVVPYRPELAGVKGWLGVLALRVVATPLVITYQLWSDREVFLQAGSAGEDRALTSLLVFEALGNLACVALSLHVLWLLWGKRRNFPQLCIWLELGGTGFAVADGVLSQFFLDLPLTDRQFYTRAMLSAGVVAYVLGSQRIKATFLPPLQTPEVSALMPATRSANQPAVGE